MAQFAAVLGASEKVWVREIGPCSLRRPRSLQNLWTAQVWSQKFALLFHCLGSFLNCTFETLFAYQILHSTENEIALKFETRAIR